MFSGWPLWKYKLHPVTYSADQCSRLKPKRDNSVIFDLFLSPCKQIPNSDSNLERPFSFTSRKIYVPPRPTILSHTACTNVSDATWATKNAHFRAELKRLLCYYRQISFFEFNNNKVLHQYCFTEGCFATDSVYTNICIQKQLSATS
jgi:hypothetical protein